MWRSQRRGVNRSYRLKPQVVLVTGANAIPQCTYYITAASRRFVIFRARRSVNVFDGSARFRKSIHVAPFPKNRTQRAVFVFFYLSKTVRPSIFPLGIIVVTYPDTSVTGMYRNFANKTVFPSLSQQPSINFPIMITVKNLNTRRARVVSTLILLNLLNR